MVEGAYNRGRGLNAGHVFEVDDVIDPVDTRRWIVAGMTANVRAIHRRLVAQGTAERTYAIDAIAFRYHFLEMSWISVRNRRWRLHRPFVYRKVALVDEGIPDVGC